MDRKVRSAGGVAGVERLREVRMKTDGSDMVATKADRPTRGTQCNMKSRIS